MHNSLQELALLQKTAIGFLPYFRAHNSLGSHIPDITGLGLAIVERLVNLLQAKIELVSQIGVGSSFTVIFPLELDGF